MSAPEAAAREPWREMGLKDHEYEKIKTLMGREPNYVELGMFAVLWSEHCGYKHSRSTLRKLPTTGPAVLQGPGENAGVVDIGLPDQAVAFRVESHNHPIAIEPYNGAATGIGGIIRDVLAMGARPIALLDSLRFGDLDDPRVRYIFGGVVSGIAGYGNCVGVPTVGGEVYFDEAYRDNPLCNVMCVGVIDKDKLTKGVAEGIGNSVMLVGAATGRDGIHGATFASEELSEDSEERRPSVQVGDPFMEKLAIEACLELIESGVVVGVQDMGAAGITSSCAETATRAGNGVEIDVDRVPLREADMTPYEIMLSESQERMLVIVERGREEEVHRICRKWGLNSVVIGHVTDDRMFRVRKGGEVVAEVPARALTDEAPVYSPASREPGYYRQVRSFDSTTVPEPDPAEYASILRGLLSSPTIASKEWVYRQYDHMVRTNTVVYPGSDAAVLRIKGTSRGIALSIDCNSRYCYLDPETGGAIAVAEAARNVVCSGARPIGITNCLNFGNPEKPEIFWQFEKVIDGMSAACRALETPVTGGNVSFYNETNAQAVYPTPTIGMVGVLDDIDQRVTAGFKRSGDVVVLLGETKNEIGGSEYLKVVHGQVTGRPPELDLDLEKRVQGACLKAIDQGLVAAAHDCSEGGSAVALAEMCFLAEPGAKGIHADLYADFRADALLFGESQSRILVEVPREKMDALMVIIREFQIPFAVAGEVTSDRFTLSVTGRRGGRKNLIDLPTAEIEQRWRGGLEQWMK